MTRLQSFSLNTDPLSRSSSGGAQSGADAFKSVRILSPYLRSLFKNLGPLITASKTGLPAVRDVLRGRHRCSRSWARSWIS